MDTLVGKDSGSFEIKEEPVELGLLPTKEDDYQSGSLLRVKIETETISQDEKQNFTKLEVDTILVNGSGCLEIKEEPLELEMLQRKEEDCQSGFQQMVKTETEGISQDDNRDILKLEVDTIIITSAGCLDIKEEPAELELQQMKEDDCQIESLRIVKIETETISLDYNQDLPNQDIATVMVTIPGSVEIKEEPGEHNPNQVKEEDHGSGPHQKEDEDTVQDVLKHEAKTLTLTASGRGTDQQHTELNTNKIIFQNCSKAEHNQEINTNKASGSRLDEPQQRKDQETGGQRDDVNIQLKDKKIHKGEKCKQSKVCWKVFKHRDYLRDQLQSHTGENRLLCTACGKGFSRKRNLYSHMRSHEKPFCCLNCDKSFSRKKYLNRHMKIHEGEESVLNNHCDKTLGPKNNFRFNRPHTVGKTLSSEVKEYTLKDPSLTGDALTKTDLICVSCGKGFISKDVLTRHMRIHSGEKPFTCVTCGKSFLHSYQLNYHTKSHTNEKSFTCKICGKVFTRSSNVHLHMRSHTGEKPFSCITCGKGFKWKNNLKLHMRTHTGEKPYSCIRCGKGFSCGSTLHRHMRTHTDKTPFSCTTCGRGFKCKYSLDVHVRGHTGEKPFSCKTCGKAYNGEKSLKRHMMTHIDKKPFLCLTCGKGFSRRSSVYVHMRTHTGERPFICVTCGQAFSVKSNLTTHMKTQHR